MRKADLAKTQEIVYAPEVLREVWPEIYQRQEAADDHHNRQEHVHISTASQPAQD
jgi:hypothetical protein